MHYERKPLISIESLAKRKVRVLNLFSSYRRLKSLKKQPFGVFRGIFQLYERKYLIADKQNSKNGLIVLYVLFANFLFMLVAFTKIELEISFFHNV